jgi:hypothetical protein
MQIVTPFLLEKQMCSEMDVLKITQGWILLGKTSVFTKKDWVQTKINLSIPTDINVIQIGP